MTDLRCPKCKYEWNYGGDLNMATCPSCTRKVNVLVNEQ